MTRGTEGLGRPSVSAAPEGVRLNIRTSLRVPTARLENRTNVCYVNSVFQVMHWVGTVSTDPEQCFGRLKAGLQLLRAAGTVPLVSTLTLRALFREMAARASTA